MLNLRFIEYRDLNEQDKSAWRELADSAEPNPFTSEEFISSAVLTYKREAILAVFKSGEALVAVVPFSKVCGNRVMPYPHLVPYSTPHSFSSGFLCVPGFLDEVCSMLLQQVEHKISVGGLEFNRLDLCGQVKAAMHIAALNSIRQFEVLGEYTRAALKMKVRDDAAIKAMIGTKRFNDNQRNLRNLKKLGDVTWRVRTDDIDFDVVSNFVHLENTGWKAESGTSIISNREDLLFFMMLIGEFRKSNKVFFTELLLNDEIIASTVNFVIKDKGFAFKIAVDEDFKQYSVGVMNEIEFMKNCASYFPTVKSFDSCADSGSFIEKLWTEDTIKIGTVVIPTNILGEAAFNLTEAYRAVNRVV